jgi:hypothetical protein
LIAAGGAAWVATRHSGDPLSAGWVARENERAGTSAWRIAPGAYGGIEGYANHVSARVGDSVKLYVSTPAPVFHIEAYRVGWYQGLGGRLVWRSPDIKGAVQPPPALLQPTRTISAASWHPTTDLHINKRWLPGDYLLKLVVNKGQAYIPLTVRDDQSHAPILVMNSVTTWQAYNDWGGYSLYFGPNANAKTRSQVVSFDRPYDWAVNPAAPPRNYTVCCGFVATELGVVATAERLGLDVAYTTDVDVEQHPSQLLQHKVIVSGGHDEYWSVPKRDAVENARAHGVNLVFLGPNAVYWRIRLEASPIGRDRLEVNYRVARDDPLFGHDDAHVTTLWRSPPPARTRPESELTGQTYFCYLPDSDGVVADAASWVFAGTGLKNGDHIARLVQGEADHVDRKFPTPPDVQLLLHSPVSCFGLKGIRVKGYYSDTTYYTAASGAGVFTSGGEWDCHLFDGCPAGPKGADPAVQRIVENVLRRFARGPAHQTSG